MDDGIADRRRPEVPCSDPKLVAAVTAARAGKSGKARQLGVFIKDANYKWPEGVICYNFDPMIVTQGLFREAMKEYTDLGLRFIDINDCAKLYKPNGQKTNVCSDCRYHVDIIPDNPGCYGSVGFHPGKRMELNVGDGCHELNTYLHELGYVVGLNHEHQHPKRRVIIIKSEMKVDASEYVKFKEGERTTTAYDINSIMHYDGSEFCIPWFTPRGGFCDADKAGNWHGWSGCMEPAKAHCSPVDRTVIGRAAHLTGHDKANVRQLYNLRA
ncbi:hypothetical protein Poli38472_001064 [Pythium oligandrum]|uniref:Metalloendopeptidase n=1 Tax=Pythium oligandrum TaxID=41045 RepID=A0A8K1FSU6_PYTOL|nr:hypothetical protein Poli38472_001064 [Pythium oligandrum]|eukprot:TMW68908.1 hypothetical protein Poli38472_001064 [Pythium oligandrum]